MHKILAVSSGQYQMNQSENTVSTCDLAEASVSQHHIIPKPNIRVKIYIMSQSMFALKFSEVTREPFFANFVN